VLSTVVGAFPGSVLHRFLLAGFGFDWIYTWFIVRPYCWVARINRSDILDGIANAGAYVFRLSNLLLSQIVNGSLRWYLACIGIGAVILIGIVILV
jgi:NADH-quinone oxidoreductase subunit L